MAVSIYVSTLTSTAIAIDRYIAIVHPFRARMTISCCLLVIVGVWAASVTVTLPLAIHQNVTFINETGSRTCLEDWPQPSVRRMFTVGR
jgi:neuropeptide Y receptor